MRRLGWAMLLLVVVWGLLLVRAPDRMRVQVQGEVSAVAKEFPNILLLASDGLSAEHLSVYGLERETIPFIQKFAEERGLICENAFANTINSGGGRRWYRY